MSKTPPAGTDPESDDSLLARFVDLAVRTLVPHAWAFLLINLALTALNWSQGAPWWALWPLLSWGVPLSIHYFIYKSVTVDEQWVDERIDDLRYKAYDLGHIGDLEDRIRSNDVTTRPTHRRDPDWWRTPPVTPGSGNAGAACEPDGDHRVAADQTPAAAPGQPNAEDEPHAARVNPPDREHS